MVIYMSVQIAKQKIEKKYDDLMEFYTNLGMVEVTDKVVPADTNRRSIGANISTQYIIESHYFTWENLRFSIFINMVQKNNRVTIEKYDFGNIERLVKENDYSAWFLFPHDLDLITYKDWVKQLVEGGDIRVLSTIRKVNQYNELKETKRKLIVNIQKEIDFIDLQIEEATVGISKEEYKRRKEEIKNR